MMRNGEGLTKTYNRFHDPDERAPEILELRKLHDDMDRAVLDAYGFNRVNSPACEFLLDYEERNDEEEESGQRRKRKPWRYRWSDEVRDEVLAQLMKLNAERYAAEHRMGADKQLAAAAVAETDADSPEKPAAAARKKAAKKKTKKKEGEAAPGLFDSPAEVGDE